MVSGKVVNEGYMHDIYIEERANLVPAHTSASEIEMTMLAAAELMIIQTEIFFF